MVVEVISNNEIGVGVVKGEVAIKIIIGIIKGARTTVDIKEEIMADTKGITMAKGVVLIKGVEEVVGAITSGSTVHSILRDRTTLLTLNVNTVNSTTIPEFVL